MGRLYEILNITGDIKIKNIFNFTAGMKLKLIQID